MHDTAHLYLHALNTLPEIGSRRLRLLIARCGSAQAAWEAGPAIWIESGLSSKLAQRAWEIRLTRNPEQLWEDILRHSIHILGESDSSYPPALREIPDPPALLYVRGTVPDWTTHPLITVIGTRKPTSYGIQVTESLVHDLVAAGVIIVSGLAFGIDALAHHATLAAGGVTIAVLGNGLDGQSIAPHTHLPLAQTIVASGGLLLSEYPPFCQPSVGTFPARNRIMAGISAGTLIIEAALRSGSLITTTHALDFNRDVFAVPGSVFSPSSDGPNSLIRSGAKLVMRAQDILEEIRRPDPLFPLPETHSKTPRRTPILPKPELSPDEAKTLQHLDTTPCHIDKLAKMTTLETSQLATALTLLEVKGLVKNTGAMHYIKVGNYALEK